MRVSQINGCAFCLRMHARDAAGAGETADRLAVLAAWWEADAFGPAFAQEPIIVTCARPGWWRALAAGLVFGSGTAKLGVHVSELVLPGRSLPVPFTASLTEAPDALPLVSILPPAVPILLESVRAQRALDVVGVAVLAAGTAAVLSIPDAVVVALGVAVITVAARRLRAWRTGSR